ncbi:MAG: TIGR00296 family protein [Candidatus Micrarchaeota archaeon]|nr:TIGR00296 family protein [Candidatus Micrarchaeota archaeon]
MFELKEGEELVAAARSAMELALISPARFDKRMVVDTLPKFKEPRGVFVTLHFYPTGALRGCIGFPTAVAPLREAVVDAAIAAAFEDPRFKPLSRAELDQVTVEVNVLSVPEEIRGGAEARRKAVRIGRDGLMVQYGIYSGLLLPEVPVQEGWDSSEFLAGVCEKAGLHRNYWTQPNVRLYRFESQIFTEETPNGKIAEVILGKG